MNQLDNYFFTVSKVAEYVDYHGVSKVLSDILATTKDPVVSAHLRSAIDMIEFEEQQRIEFEKRYAYAESIFEEL